MKNSAKNLSALKHSLLALLLLIQSAWAQATPTWRSKHEAVWDTRAKAWITPQQMAAQSRSGDIWILGEDHATSDNFETPETIVHHDNQVRLLTELIHHGASAPQTEARHQVSVGMEFLTYTFQSQIDRYLAGQLTESEFLKTVEWGAAPYSSYRTQILLPTLHQGWTWGLNIPRNISSRVAKVGPEGLTPEERAVLPPVWNRGNTAYFERFREAMGGHVPDAKIENYFWAQSLWDSTMAWRAQEAKKLKPRDVLLIVVGSFHVAYGGGLPDTLKIAGETQVKTVLQAQAPDWKPETLQNLVAPDPRDGEQADFIWVHSADFK